MKELYFCWDVRSNLHFLHQFISEIHFLSYKKKDTYNSNYKVQINLFLILSGI